jgi:hypothetical protein
MKRCAVGVINGISFLVSLRDMEHCFYHGKQYRRKQKSLFLLRSGVDP